jgi:hypothetical protein
LFEDQGGVLVEEVEGEGVVASKGGRTKERDPGDVEISKVPEKIRGRRREGRRGRRRRGQRMRRPRGCPELEELEGEGIVASKGGRTKERDPGDVEISQVP